MAHSGGIAPQLGPCDQRQLCALGADTLPAGKPQGAARPGGGGLSRIDVVVVSDGVGVGLREGASQGPAQPFRGAVVVWQGVPAP